VRQKGEVTTPHGQEGQGSKLNDAVGLHGAPLVEGTSPPALSYGLPSIPTRRKGRQLVLKSLMRHITPSVSWPLHVLHGRLTREKRRRRHIATHAVQPSGLSSAMHPLARLSSMNGDAVWAPSPRRVQVQALLGSCVVPAPSLQACGSWFTHLCGWPMVLGLSCWT
jgi:hypothetical protein